MAAQADPWFLFVGCAMAGLGGTLIGLGLVLTLNKIIGASRDLWRHRT